MKILGMSIKSMNASKEDIKDVNDVKINRIPSITDIKKYDADFFDQKNVASIGFEFRTEYEPKVGKVEIKGELLCTAEDVDKIVNDWKNEKKMDKDMTFTIMNFIMRECILKSANLCHELKLPMPLKFPKFVEGKN